MVECPDIPYTVSGKKVEIAVRKCVEKQAIKNASALRNPDALAFFQNVDVDAAAVSPA